MRPSFTKYVLAAVFASLLGAHFPVYAEQPGVCAAYLQEAGTPWFDDLKGDYSYYRSNQETTEPDGKTEYYRLGAGTSGIVFRVIKNEKTSYVKKEFHDENRKSLELAAFQIFAQALQGFEKADIAKVTNSDKPLEIEITDTRGRALDDVIRNELVPEPMREELKKNYDSLLRHMRDFIQTAYSGRVQFQPFPGTYMGLDILYAFIETSDPSRPIPVHVKPDNIIVDPYTLRMTVVDPF